MLILQKPEGLLFEKNIPDIILQKENDEVSVDVVIKICATVILQENYKFDVDGYITVRRLDEIVSTYLSAEKTVISENVITTGLIVDFSFSLNELADNTFSVLRCEADMPTELNAETFVKNNFLTRLPREKRTATNLNEYLSYVHLATYSSVMLHYKAVYNLEGVRTEKTGTFATIPVQAADCFVTFNASLAKIRTIAALPDEYIYQYDLWFTETSESLESNVFTFMVMDVYYRNRKHFVFENSFGVLETFTATGRSENKKTVEINLANIQGRYRKTTQDFVAETTVNSGLLSAEEMDWLDDLLLSYNVALYTPGVSGADEEITLTGSDKVDTEANELQAFTFSYRRAKNNHLQFTAAARGIFDTTFDTTFN